jgi:hypothetical protein
VDPVPDEHAAAASARPATGTAQRRFFEIERTALPLLDCRLSTIDPRLTGAYVRFVAVVDSYLRFVRTCAEIRYFG